LYVLPYSCILLSYVAQQQSEREIEGKDATSINPKVDEFCGDPTKEEEYL
jgi:hypothetical protein